MKAKKPEHKHFRYYWFRKYVIFFFRLYFPRVFVRGRDKVPAEGHPVLMPGCHQNTFLDALAPSLVLGDRRTRGLLRSDIFSIPVLSWFVRKLGMYPIARLEFEGAEAQEKYNDRSIAQAAEAMAEGHTLIMFPEAGHQQGRYLGTFSQSYIRFAMQAAALHGYRKEVYIAPYAHHYANYHHPFYDMMVMFGEPIALSPYYDAYQEAPRATRRQISARVEQEIRELMLDIGDRQHYEAIDFLRQSRLGTDFCKAQGKNPRLLPDKLDSDKLLVRRLEEAQQRDVQTDAWLDKAEGLRKKMREAGVRDWLFDAGRPLLRLIAGIVLALLLLPAAAISLALTFPMFLLPYLVKKRPVNGAYDPMFSSTCDLVGTIIFTFPLFCVLPAIILMLCVSWWFVLYPLAALGMAIFYCLYQRLCVKTWGLFNFCRRRTLMKQLARRREEIFAKIGKLIQG